MRLKAGQQAPRFEAQDLFGRRVSLADYRGKTLLLSFYRAAVCPLCNMRTAQLVDRYPAYQRRGLSIIAFFESSPAYTHRYLDRLRVPFPVIADLECTVYALYGLESSWLGAAWARLFRGATYREAARRHIGGNIIENVFRMDGRFGRLPGDFLIGPDLRIRTAYYGRDAGDFMLLSELEYYLAAR